MKKLIASVVLLTGVYTLTACNMQFSTANIADAKLAKTVDENARAVDPTDSFASTDTEIHCVVELANAPSETKVQARWMAVKAEGVDANSPFVVTDIVAGGGKDNVDFKITAQNGLPPGDYKVELYLNPQEGKPEPPAKALSFSIKAAQGTN